MACPFFEPGNPMGSRLQARLPLGRLYSGTCRADECVPFEPSDDQLRDCCNIGYASAACSHFKTGHFADAVRFGVAADDGRVLALHCVLEKDYHPFGYELHEYDLDQRLMTGTPVNPVLGRQAEAFIASYLEQKAAR